MSAAADGALRGVELLAELDADAQRSLADAAEQVTFPAGTALVRDGEQGDAVLVLTSGTARVVVGGRPRRDLGAGSVIGEISLLDGRPRSATVYAVDDVQALRLDGATVRRVLDEDPAGRYPAVVRGLCRRLRGLEQDRWAAEEQRRLQELQDLFLANVGHELRTPLTTAMGFLQLVTSRELPRERLTEALETVHRGLRGLHHIVEDLLALAAHQRHDEQLEVDRYPVRVLVDGALSALVSDTARVDVQVPEDLVVLGDGSRLTQVIADLVDNAVKFGPRDEPVEVRAHLEDGRVLLDVVDRGTGIPVEDRDLIFQLFQQRDPSSTRRHGGLGVGLAVARSTARLHGGDLVLLEQAPTTTFRLHLPLAGPPTGPPPSTDDATGEPAGHDRPGVPRGPLHGRPGDRPTHR